MKIDTVGKFVSDKIRLLERGDSWSKAMLAKLRRGVGKDPAEVPDIWEVTMGGIPDELTCKSGEFKATEAELAIHTALTLYAMHQQSNAKTVNTADKSFASATRSLISAEKGNEAAVKRRFDAIVTANDMEELAHHARGLIQLMKSSDKPIMLNYPMFAEDLYRFQFPEGKLNVRLKWGQDFYRMTAEEKTLVNKEV